MTNTSHNTTRSHARRGPPRRIRRQPSAAQLRQRNGFRKALAFWKTHADAAVIQAWFIYALHHPTITPNNTAIHRTAFQAFMSHNIYRAVSGAPLRLTPPAD